MDNKIMEITNRIYIIRDQKIMIDYDLAYIYNTSVGRLNEQVKRNIDRFPEDFCFKLNFNEFALIKSQNAIRNDVTHRKGIIPRAFTEQGAYALSFVLRSPRAIEMGIFIARAFTHLRRFILKNENLMMELKNNDSLSKTFANFEKRIEQDLIVLYKNTSIYRKELDQIKKRLTALESNFKKSIK